MTRRRPLDPAARAARLAAAPPEVRALVAMQARTRASSQISRRAALQGAGLLGLGAFLAACGTSGTGGGSPSSADLEPAQDRSDQDKTLAWANWTLYLDLAEDGTTYPTLEAFQDETGIEVSYSEDIDGNDTYFGKIQGQLANGDDIGQDIVVFTDWMAGRMISLGYTQELDRSRIPNADNILDSLADVDFDPGRKHSLTWQSGFAGLAWNKAEVPGGLSTVEDLWRPELKGRVEVLDEWRDTIGLIMSSQGVDISSDWGADEFGAAVEVLEEQIASGQIRQVKGNSYKEDLISGDALAVIGWSGDITQINFENGDQWQFAIPETGGTLWSDNMLVPIGSPHKKNAETLMNYYYDPAVAAEVAAYVNYICPVEGAKEAMVEIDPELAEDTSIFPDEATLSTVKVIRSLSADEETEFGGQFQTAIGN
jgi:spermidine/putrescine transport system substrate-binding protein